MELRHNNYNGEVVLESILNPNNNKKVNVKIAFKK